MALLGLRYFADRVGEGNGRPRLDAEAGEELMHVQPAVSIALGNRPLESSGTLYITTKKVVWLSDTDKGKGYAVDILAVSLHAVSRDPEVYSFPCIYTQIENDAVGDDTGGSDVENNDDFELTSVTEMRLVPSDPNQLDALFNIFCECAELNPDPNQEQDEDNEWIFGDEQMAGDDDPEYASEVLANPIGHSNGDHDLCHTMLELEINDQRFEDAEESDPETHGEHH